MLMSIFSLIVVREEEFALVLGIQLCMKLRRKEGHCNNVHMYLLSREQNHLFFNITRVCECLTSSLKFVGSEAHLLTAYSSRN